METNPTIEDRESRPFYVRMFSKRALRIYLFVLAALVTLIALWHAEENWRGAHAWNAYKQQRIAAGYSFDWHQVVPPRVADDQNFAMTPFLKPLFDFYPPDTQNQRDTNAATRTREFGKDFPAGGWHWTNEIELVGLANFLLHPKDTNAQPTITDRKEAARVILQNMEQYSPVIEELRSASSRPSARFNVAYDIQDKPAMVLPHLFLMRNITRMLAIRSTAELALGQNEQALADVELGLYLGESIKAEPIIISQLVRQACVRVTLMPVLTGLREHAWNDAQIQKIQTALEKIDLLAGVKLGLDGEAKMHNAVLDDLKATPNRLRVINHWTSMMTTQVDTHNRFVEFLFWVAVPKGWIDFERLNYMRYYLDKIDSAMSMQNGSIDPRSATEADQAAAELASINGLGKALRHKVILTIALPAFGKLAQKTALAQAYVNMAQVACALERYRLANGHYPDDLKILVPQFIGALPNDPIKGGELKYHPTGDSFVLYSVGWNAIDDGGKTVMGKGTTPHANANEGDWVWGSASNY